MQQTLLAQARALVCLAAGLVAAAGRGADTPAAVEARRILDASGVRGGLIVQLGCGDGALTAALRANPSYLVQGLDPDPARVAAARATIRAQGVYGPVSVGTWSGGRLPYVDNSVNLLVADGLDGLSPDEVNRVLVPNGVALTRQGDPWRKTVKPRPGDIDEWTHYLHDPSNNAVAHDAQVGPLRRFQWVGSLRYSRHHDHMSAASAMVAANGRLFYIFEDSPRASILTPPQWFLAARDAFNGTLLWRRPIETWHEHLWPLKSGPQLLTRRLVAVGDRVYVTLGLDAPLSILDAATGETVRTLDSTAATEEILVQDGMLILSVAAPGQPLRSDPKKPYADMAAIRAAVTDPLWTDAPRTLMAVEAATGNVFWKHESTVVAMSLAADARRVVFHDGQRLQCLDRRSGKPLWASEPVARREGMRSSGGATVVLYDEVLLYSGQVPVANAPAGSTAMSALSATDGHKLWEAVHPPCGHSGTSDDILVLNGVVWCGAVAGGTDSGVMTGRELRTGKVLKEFPPDVEAYWFHHRCYRAKATDKYLLFSRTGIEFVDVAASHWTIHHWVRGACLYGILPANGLIYSAPHPCACYLEAKLSGFYALAPALSAPVPALAEEARLERGPAYDTAVAGAATAPAAAADWPTYRHDPSRSGTAGTAVVATGLAQQWQTEIGGRLSSPVIADGRLFVAAVDTHQVLALAADTGKELWSFTAGGRVDSAPTVWQGRVLFGSADGWVYCLRATDGQVMWRFSAAPADLRMGACEQVESVWPVPGSVLVQGDTACVVAGRSVYLDGGLRLVRLDPRTGRKLSETVLDDRDPESKQEAQNRHRGLNLPVGLPDVLSGDGRYVYMRSLPFALDGQRQTLDYVEVKAQQGDDLHLFSPTGFLDDTMWHRTYWVYGRAFASGAGGYFQAGRLVPAGRLLVVDGDTVYGYGRLWQYYRWTTPLECHLFAAARQPEVLKMAPPPAARDKNGKPKFSAGATPTTRFAYAWSASAPVQAMAMVKAGDVLFVAGPPDVIDEESALKSLREPATVKGLVEQEAAFEGKRGALLAAVSAADGKGLSTYRLPALPTFDGMAAAGGRLYLTTAAGTVLCLAGGQGQPLPAEPGVSVTPRSPDSDRPLASAAAAGATPPQAPTTTHPDFQYLAAVSIAPAALGYRVAATEEENGFALRALATPLSHQATLKLQMKPLVEAGRLQTGFLVFGDGTADEQLVKCGVRVRAHKALIIQGAMKNAGVSQPFTAPADAPFEVEVAVDFEKHTVRMSLPGPTTIEAPLDPALARITHVGYGTMNAVTEFSPVSVVGK